MFRKMPLTPMQTGGGAGGDTVGLKFVGPEFYPQQERRKPMTFRRKRAMTSGSELAAMEGGKFGLTRP